MISKLPQHLKTSSGAFGSLAVSTPQEGSGRLCSGWATQTSDGRGRAPTARSDREQSLRVFRPLAAMDPLPPFSLHEICRSPPRPNAARERCGGASWRSAQNGVFLAAMNLPDTLPASSILSGSRIITGAPGWKLNLARSIQITLGVVVSSKK